MYTIVSRIGEIIWHEKLSLTPFPNFQGSHKYERNFGNDRDVKNIRDGVSFEKLFSIALKTQTAAATRMFFYVGHCYNI